jgi:clan AA aspartic protease (TIGR02281 family)
MSARKSGLIIVTTMAYKGKVMNKKVIQGLFIVMLAATSTSALCEGMIYKCKNQEGALIYQKSPCQDTAATVSAWTPKLAAQPVVAETGKDKGAKKEPSPVLTLKQNSGGHYTADGSIEGKSLSFVVDTGASFVSLPESVAHGALIYCDDKINMNTANGNADACTAKIKKLQFGPFQVENVAAVIVPNLSQPLLGMNVLQLFKVAQEKGEMHISIQEKENP